MQMNVKRANRAQLALEAYTGADVPGYAAETIETRIADMICDVLHLASRNAIGVEEMVAEALSNFHAEEGEEGAAWEGYA
jgi:hypothetical protein